MCARVKMEWPIRINDNIHGNTHQTNAHDNLIVHFQVFMVSGLNVFFQQPIAYYLHTTMKAEDRVELVTQILCELSKRGVQVSNLTFDGYSSNAKMSKLLGANFLDKEGNYKTFFQHPSDGRKIYIMYDPSHMEKLVRTTLGTLQTIYHGNEKIEWKFFENLVNFGRSDNFGLSLKINKRHLEFKDRKMHVRTAVETLSSTNAKAMDFLMKKGLCEFKGAAPTVTFTNIFDKLWDVMNTHRIRRDTENIFKSALNAQNRNQIFRFLRDAKAYILSLKIKHPKTGKLIKLIHSDYRTGFRGFAIDIISLTAMYTDFVEEHHWLLFFATYRISQDHLEIMFGKIRGMNGCNDNPMAHQFISAYRKLLHQCEIMHSPYSNVHALAGTTAKSLVTSNILNVPSTRRLRSSLLEDVNSFAENQLNESDVDDATVDLEETYELDLVLGNNYSTDSTHNSGIAYIANTIEQRCLKSSQIYCNSCVAVIKHNPKVDVKLCINPNQGIPCLSTYQICKLTDVNLKTLINTGPNFKRIIYRNVLSSLQWENIFPLFFPHQHDFEHKLFLVKLIIDDYVNKKCNFLAKQKTIDTQKRYFRNKLRKLAHYYNQ